MRKITIRQAKKEDLLFLYGVSTMAMRRVVEALHSKDRSLDEYMKTFEPEKIEVIQCDGIDVGRLRVVRSKESIYIGGIQILPEYQGKGIGTELMNRIIEESNTLRVPITLEVHEVNIKAKSFYTKLGFNLMEVIDGKSTLKYFPS